MMYNEELYHHGIKGQRWGVRRFQNTDGSLTTAGKDRYSTKEERRELKREAKREFRDKKRELNRRSDEEVRKYNERLEKIDKTADKRSALGNKRAKIMAEYENDQKQNAINQERLDAKRAYREKIGKKRVDTLFMKLTQGGINDIRNQSYKDFEKEWLGDEERRIQREAVDKYIKSQSESSYSGNYWRNQYNNW